MTYRYQLEQPRPIKESKMVKHIKNMSEEEQDNYNFLVCKHKLFNIYIYMGIKENAHPNLIIPSHCNHNLIIVIIFKLIAMIEEYHFISHVANGIHILFF